MTFNNKNKALFLDRDVTINVEENYVFRTEDFEFIPGIFELLKSYQHKRFLLFKITNNQVLHKNTIPKTIFIV